MIRTSVTTPNLGPAVERLIPTAEDMIDLANQSAVMIRRRTTGGTDIDGAQFQPYSQGYEKYKREQGRDTSKVDLTFQNHMLGSMTARRIQDGAELYFSDAERRIIARRHNLGQDGMPKREFFGLNEKEQNELMKLLQARINRRAAS